MICVAAARRKSSISGATVGHMEISLKTGVVVGREMDEDMEIF
jgi:hypothetical protein